MSIWKSPVFYFGVVLLLLVSAALAAPYIVNWNSYREDLQQFGERLTGRNVTISGDIAVKLFPWPQLEAHQVAIGNPDGFSEGDFVKADTMRVSLALAGLVNGSLDVENVETESLLVNLQRNASGDVNWFFSPKENVAGAGLLSRVKLDQIVLRRAFVAFDDLKNGYSTVLSEVDATLSAAAVTGPWRLRGDAKWNEVAMGVTVTSGEKKPEQPLNFTVKLTPVDAAFPNFAFEGAWQGKDVKGRLRIDPQEQKGGKTSAEGTLKPLTLQADVNTSIERMSLLNIKIAPQDRKDSGTLIEGDAVVAFGSQAEARVELKSPRINLDTLLGAGAMQQWRDGGFLVVMNQLLANTPAKLVLDYKATVNVLTSGGETLNDLRIAGSVQREAIRVNELVADLPGRSVGVFDGILFPGAETAQLGGKLQFESFDMRAFLSWLKPAWRPIFDKHWTGSRGRFELKSSNVNWNRDRFELADMRYLFEGIPGQGDMSLNMAGVPVFGINIETTQLDLDALVPNGWSIVRDGGFSFLNAPAADTQAVDWERDIGLKANTIVANGATAQDVQVKVATRPQGIEIKGLKIGNVGGASLTGTGELLDNGNGPEGELKFNLVAMDPRGFMRLAGFEYGNASWSAALGQTDLQFAIRSLPGGDAPQIELRAEGTSGPLSVNSIATLKDFKKGDEATVSAQAKLFSADGGALVQLIGMTPQGALGKGAVDLRLDGRLNGQLAVSAVAEVLGGQATFNGTTDLQKPWLAASGKFKAEAPDGGPLLTMMGIPLAEAGQQPLSISALVAEKDGALSLLDIAGAVAGHRLAGGATLEADGKFSADIETDVMHVKDALALAFLSWDGGVTDLSRSFPDLSETSLRGEVFIRPIQFETGLAGAREEVVVGISFGPKQRAISITSPGEEGLSADVILAANGTSNELNGTYNWPVILQDQVSGPDGPLLQGNLRLAGEFQSSGRSPAAALAAANGKGNYWLSDGRFARMTLDGFAEKTAGVTTSQALTETLRMLEAPPGTEIGQRIGNYELVNGELTFSPIDIRLPGTTAQIAPKLDMPAGQLRVATTVNFTTATALPPVTVNYVGMPGQMVTRTGTAALAAKLGYEFLAREMQQLEKLQQEQQALALKEEAQRKADEQRFADYQQTRVELRQQARIRKFHAAEREKAAQELKAITEFAIRNGPAFNRIEIAKQQRRRAIFAPPAIQPQP